MSDTESDSSIEPIEEEPENVKIPPTSMKKEKKIKKIIYESDSDNDSDEEEVLREPVKKRPTRKKAVPKPTTIVKEKVIYMIPDKDGGYKKVKNPELTKRDLVRIEREKELQAKEQELGKRLLAKKNGKLDKRSVGGKTRSPAQIEATKKLLEANRIRREANKKLKDHEKKETTKKLVKESVREVVSEPFYEPKHIKNPEPVNPFMGKL